MLLHRPAGETWNHFKHKLTTPTAERSGDESLDCGRKDINLCMLVFIGVSVEESCSSVPQWYLVCVCCPLLSERASGRN